MSSLKTAIRKTLNYARFFSYDLTDSELHFWLVSDQEYPLKAIRRFSHQSAEATPSRKKSRQISQKKILIAKKVARFLAHIPSIRLIAITGSLAMENAKPNHDIDLMIVTSPHTLWLTRPLVYLLLKTLNLRRHPNLKHSSKESSNKICDNLWLDSSALKLPKEKQNLYTAHEVLQIKPIFDRGHTYQQFINQNSWAKEHLANAYEAVTSSFTPSASRGKPSKGGWVGLRLLNLLAFKLQHLYMKSKITKEHITLHSAFFHPRNLAPRVESFISKALP